MIDSKVDTSQTKLFSRCLLLIFGHLARAAISHCFVEVSRHFIICEMITAV